MHKVFPLKDSLRISKLIDQIAMRLQECNYKELSTDRLLFVAFLASSSTVAEIVVAVI